jgi:hypothetical protein
VTKIALIARAGVGLAVLLWEGGWYVPAWLVARGWRSLRGGWRDGLDT